MPQLDLSSFASQLFWLAFSFMTLFFGLRFFLPELQSVLKKRKRHIMDALRKSKKMQEEIEKSEKAIQQIEARVAEELSDTISAATAEESSAYAIFSKEASQTIRRQQQEEKKQIIKAMEAERRALKDKITKLAPLMASRIKEEFQEKSND